VDLRQLATFREVAETRSFTAAAERLGYAQSSVTVQIQTLEQELGVPLFDRLGRRIALTDAGARLMRYAERLLDLADEARRALADGSEPTGTIMITARETVCAYRLPVLLHAFRQRYPSVIMRLRPLPSAELRRAVADGEVDVAFVLDEPFQASGLYVEPLLTETLCVVAPPRHHLTRLSVVRPSDLVGETLLLHAAGCAYRGLFVRGLEAAGLRDLDTLEFRTVEAIKQCVMADMGIAVLPVVAAEAEIAQGRLVALPWSVPGFQLVTHLVWHRDRWLSPAVRAFLDLAREVIGRQPRQEADEGDSAGHLEELPPSPSASARTSSRHICPPPTSGSKAH
jgi:DNA-binding transcriptional LysR family regulator